MYLWHHVIMRTDEEEEGRKVQGKRSGWERDREDRGLGRKGHGELDKEVIRCV